MYVCITSTYLYVNIHDWYHVKALPSSFSGTLTLSHSHFTALATKYKDVFFCCLVCLLSCTDIHICRGHTMWIDLHSPNHPQIFILEKLPRIFFFFHFGAHFQIKWKWGKKNLCCFFCRWKLYWKICYNINAFFSFFCECECTWTLMVR